MCSIFGTSIIFSEVIVFTAFLVCLFFVFVVLAPTMPVGGAPFGPVPPTHSTNYNLQDCSMGIIESNTLYHILCYVVMISICFFFFSA